MKITDLLPTTGIPPTGYPAGKEFKWMCHDSLENYRLKKGHPVYGENDITYNLNSLGYRCPEFDVDADIRIVTVGCSYVMGLAMPRHALFHEVFAERLQMRTKKSVVVWNLGMSGASNDYISRMLYLALPQLDPHLILINFTHQARREYISVQNHYMNYTPALIKLVSDDVTKDICRKFDALNSPFDGQLNFYRNYKAVERLLAGKQWLYSHIHPPEFAPISMHMDLSRYVGWLERIDLARDQEHPGPESHRRLAEFYWTRFVELGGLR